MIVTPIASGSSGNAYHISDGTSSLLLDAGIPLKRIQEGCGHRVTSLSGCLITHAHIDHVKAAQQLAKLGVNIYTSQGTIDAAGLTGHRIRPVKSKIQFDAGTFTVLPIDVEHDAPEPLGFVIRSRETGEKLLYVTDTQYIRCRFEGLTHIMIEANYDNLQMYSQVHDGHVDIKRAVRTVGSHMSIDTLIRTLESFDLSRLQHIWLLHLSNDNSIEEQFKRRVQEVTGVEVTVC